LNADIQKLNTKPLKLNSDCEKLNDILSKLIDDKNHLRHTPNLFNQIEAW